MNSTTTVGIEVRADGTQKAARDLADVDASLKKIGTGLGGTAQPAGAAAQGLEQLGAAGKSAGAGLGAAGQAAGTASPKLSGVGASAKKAAEGLGSVSKFASTAKFDKVVTDLGAMGVKLNTSSLHAQKLAKAMQQVERERAFQQLAADANLSTLQLAKFRAELGDTRGALATLSNGFGLSKAAVLAFAAALAFGGKAALDAALQADRLSKAYTTITGSSSAAQAQLGYLYDVSNRLGLQFQSTAEAAKTFFAAGKGTTLEKDMNAVFEAVSSAGSALSLSTDDMHGAFIALGQMISKGKVQAEELRGQLGERLPGAFQLAAKAMNMTTAQLDKFMADGKLTAEELLPKLAKVMQEDFGAAAEAAANGLQGQLNRLSTEWTRLKAEMLDADSAASAVGTLAQAMKSLADNGATVGAIISKVLQFAVWIAGVYAFIKALGGLVSVFTTLKTISSAVSFAGIVSGAGAIAVVVAAAAVAITSLCTSTATADEIFRKHQSTIDAYKKKMGEAADEVRNFTAEQDEAYRKSLERQRDVLKTDIAAATQSINSALSGIRFLSLDQIFSADGTQFVEARSELESLGRELAKLGQNITQEDLDAYAAKVRAIDERMRAAGLATKAWNDAIDKLLYSNDAFVKNLSALIAKGMSVEDALRQLAAEAERTKVAVGTGWNIDIDNVTKGINTIEKSIRSMQSEMLGGKVFEKIVSSLPKEFPLEKAKEIFDIYQKTPNLEPWQRAGQVAAALGDQYVAMGDDAVKGINKLFSAGANLGKTQAKYAAYQKELRDAAKDHASAYNQMENNLASYVSELNQTKSSIHSLQAQLATKPGEVFTREQNKIAAEYRATVEKINAEATRYTNKKGITKTQAEELKQSKLQEASLQRNLDLRQAQEKEEKRLADLAKDRYEFYKELEEITGQYGLSLKLQSEVIAAQVKELERLQIPQQYIDQWKQLKELQASKDWADGAVRGIMKFRAEASDTASQTEDAFNGLFSGIQSSTQSMWEDFLETGKLSLSSLKSVFKSFIAQLLNIAVMNPIIVQIAGSVQNSLWGASAGSALAGTAQSGPGGAMNLLSAGTSFLPGGSVTGMINEAAAWAMPNLFSTTSGYMEAAGTELLKAGVTGTAPSATPAAGTFTSYFGTPALGAGVGSLVSPYVNNILGLQNNKGSQIGSTVGGLGATAVLGTMAATNFWNPAGWVSAGLAALSSVLGGSLGSLFGGGRKTHASVYGKMEDVGFSRDQQTYIDAFMGGATYDRAGSTEAQKFAETIGTAASTTAGTILDLAAALPEEYRKNVEDQLASATWTAGRGISGASWNLQWWKEGMAEERTTEAINDMMAQMGYAANAAFANAGIGNLFDSFDLSNDEGLKKAANAVNSINTITTAIDQLKNLTTDVEAQANTFVTQIDALKESVKSYGVNASYADALVEQYRTAYVDSYVEALDEMFNPLSEIETQAKGYKEAIDGYAAALTTMGASEEQLAKVRGYTQSAIDSILFSLSSAFDPLSDVEQQTLATMQSLTAYEAALKTLGATADELAKVDEARAKVQADLRSQAETYISTTPQIVTQTKATIEKLDNLHGAMLVAGNSAADLALIEQGRAKVQADLLAQVNAYIEAVPDVVSSTRDTMTSLLGLRDAMIEAGVSAEGMTRIDAAWGKMQADLLTQARDMVQTVPTVTSALAGVKSGFDGLRQAMEEAGSGLADITELEELRAQALNKAKAAYSVAFFEDLSARTATVTGGDVTGIQLDATHRKQLEEAANTFGKDTAEYTALVAVQQAEQLKHQAELAQAAADAATSAYNTAKSSADSLAAAANQAAAAVESAKAQAENARLALVKGLIDALDNAKAAMQSALDAWVSGAEDAYTTARDAYVSALNTEASELESTIDAHRQLAEALRQTRRDLWLDTSLNSQQSVYKSSKSEVDRLYGLAMSGDTDAANELQSVAKTFLSASYASQSDFSDYIKDFDEVQAKLKAVEDKATRQADAQESELTALKKQIDAQTETAKSVEELRVEMEAARKQMERAQAEQKRVYEHWGLEALVPGLAGLEVEYRKQAEELRVAERDLNNALLDGLTTQSEIDSLRVTSSIDTLRDTLSTSLAAIETAIAENARAQAEAAKALAAAAAAKAEADRLAAEAAQKQQAAANAAQSAQDKVNESVNTPTVGVYGSKYATVDALLAAKTESLNRGEHIAAGAPSSGWSPSSAQAAMIAECGSVEAWYAMYGKAEGFAVGGLAMPGWAIVGERGPELVNFSTPGRVYTAEQTQRMLAQPAYGTDGSSAASFVWMRERIAAQDTAFAEMISVLRAIGKETYRSRELLDGMAESGIGTYAVTQTVQKSTWAE